MKKRKMVLTQDSKSKLNLSAEPPQILKEGTRSERLKISRC